MTVTEIAPSRTKHATDDAVLQVDGLTVAYGREGHDTRVVHGATFAIARGETLALVGQSGSGKSTIALAAAGLLPASASTGGSVRIDGSEVLGLGRAGWKALRGGVVGYIPQDPLSSLDPLQRIGTRIGQALRRHGQASRADARRKSIELLEHVGIRGAEQRLRAYPHELSGGQLQRVLIALAIAGRPRLLIADEPTSALDVTVQKTILDLIETLQAELGLSVLLITHDLALAHDRSDSIVVLDGGVIQDAGPARQVLDAPTSAYTRELFANAPGLSPERYDDRRAHRLVVGESQAADVLAVRELSKTFAGSAAPAVNRVSFSVRPGRIHALVGESGSGKTTIARILAGLESFAAGEAWVGERALDRSTQPSNPHARDVQLVYQNPLAALDPRYTVRRSLEEPLRIHGVGDAAQRAARVRQVLESVALSASLLDRRPLEISGGQRQRVAIARALVLAPRTLILDEPTSALDVTVQAQIIDVLLGLRDDEGLSYLFISHDLSLVRQIADDVAVLENGVLVEQATVRELFDAPQSAYTARLLDAVPGRGLRDAFAGDTLRAAGAPA